MKFNGKKLKELRKQKKISQEDLSKRVYVSRSAIAQYESCKMLPPKNTITDIAKVLEVEETYFLTDENCKKTNWFKKYWKAFASSVSLIILLLATANILAAYDRRMPKSLYSYCNASVASIEYFELESYLIPDYFYVVPKEKYQYFVNVIKEVEVQWVKGACRCDPICSFKITLKNHSFYQLEGYRSIACIGKLVTINHLKLLNETTLMTFLINEFGG